MLDRGGDEPADGVAIAGAFFAGQPTGDVLLALTGPQVTFGLVGGGRHGQVMGEAQYVGLTVAQHLQYQSGLAPARAGACVEGVGEPDQHAVAEPADQLVASDGVDLVPVGAAGEVGLVDQLAQRVGDLDGPDGVGVDLGGVVKIT